MAIQIITTVGTSVITNYKSQFGTTFFNSKRLPSINTEYDFLEKNQPNEINENAILGRLTQKWVKGIRKIKDAKGKVDWEANPNQLNVNCCAEVQTIQAIAQKPEFAGQELHIYLLTTETVLSNLAARVIEKAYPNEENARIKVVSIKEVEGLQVDNYDNFKDTGFNNLFGETMLVVKKLETYQKAKYLLEAKNKKNADKLLSIGKENHLDFSQISDKLKNKGTGSWDFFLTDEIFKSIFDEAGHQIILNISGGYKAIIPIMTIIGQLYNLPLYYTYEDSIDLISINKLPINFDWSFAERYTPFLDNNFLSDITQTNEYRGKIIDVLQKQNLIENIKNSDLFKVSIIGNLFKDYVNAKMPISNTGQTH